MSKKSNERIDDYPLFYEEIGRRNDQTLEQTKKESNYDRSPSLNAEDLAKLSDDLRSPLKGNSSESNPMQ